MPLRISLPPLTLRRSCIVKMKFSAIATADSLPSAAAQWLASQDFLTHSSGVKRRSRLAAPRATLTRRHHRADGPARFLKPKTPQHLTPISLEPMIRCERLALLCAPCVALTFACDMTDGSMDPLTGKDSGTQLPAAKDSGTQQQEPMDSGTPPQPVDSGTPQQPVDSGTPQQPVDSGTPAGRAGTGTPTMSFFVTSRGNGKGGDFRLNAGDADGLAGADAFCKMLATAVSPTLGAKTWRAYLSTSTVDARDRIGAGPWRNQKGVVIASSVAQLHEEGGQTNALSATNSLDELGAPLVNGVHDILTGSTIAGRLMGANTCANWTSANAGTATVGHTNRMGAAPRRGTRSTPPRPARRQESPAGAGAARCTASPSKVGEALPSRRTPRLVFLA